MVDTSLNSPNLYPDSDGKPIADNTLQYRWIVRLVGNLKRLLKDQTAFVAGDLLWYPIEVDVGPAPSQVPDVMVVLGRPDPDTPASLITALNLPWTSPLLQIRFELFEDGLAVFYPDGEPFQDFVDLAEALDQAQSELDQTQVERDRTFAKLCELGIDPMTL